MESNKIKSINLFKKIGYSISKFEKYPNMAVEGFTSAVKYLAFIMLILSVLLTIKSVINTKEMIYGIADYINQNIPEFIYDDGNITMDINEKKEIQDIPYSGIDYIIIDTNAETEEQKQKIKSENNKIGTSVYFFKNQIVLETKIENKQSLIQEYTYKDFISSYTQQDINKFDKAELINYLKSDKMNNFYIRYSISLLFYFVLLNIIVGLIDALQLSILGWITSVIAKVKINFIAIYNMSIYSLTISILLNCIYVIVNFFIDYSVPYFSIAYITIAYVCLAATIFIIKDDLIKKQIEVEKIEKEQEKVKEEIIQQENNDNKQKKKEDDDKKEEDKDIKKENSDQEPNGSQA